MTEPLKRDATHDTGVHVYEGFISVVRRGRVVFKFEGRKFERGDVLSMIYDEITGRVAVTLNAELIYMTPSPALDPDAEPVKPPPPADPRDDDPFAGMADTEFDV